MSDKFFPATRNEKKKHSQKPDNVFMNPIFFAKKFTKHMKQYTCWLWILQCLQKLRSTAHACTASNADEIIPICINTKPFNFFFLDLKLVRRVPSSISVGVFIFFPCLHYLSPTRFRNHDRIILNFRRHWCILALFCKQCKCQLKSRFCPIRKSWIQRRVLPSWKSRSFERWKLFM